MSKIGVVLSGSGVYDGSEIHEAVLTLYFLDKKGAEVITMAPSINQLHVINHLTGEEVSGESRNVLVESARIARGNIVDIKDVSATDFDALIFPGGFGAAKNLTTFAVDGADCHIDPDVKRIIKETIDAKKPLAAICIAPVLIAKAFEGTDIASTITIGNEEGVASVIEKMGSVHLNCPVEKVVVDEKHKIITSPAYMLGQSISEVAEGIEETVHKLLQFL